MNSLCTRKYWLNNILSPQQTPQLLIFFTWQIFFLDSHKYIMEIRKIVKENNFDVKDYEKCIFVRVALGETIEIDSEEEN